MIARTKEPPHRDHVPGWHEPFQQLLPGILRQATFALGNLSPEARAEAIQEVVVSSMIAFIRLFERGNVDLAYPTVLARYAVAQFRDGRRVASSLNINDVLSPHARRRRGIKVDRLDQFDADQGSWKQILVEDRTATPADVAATRIDFDGWVRTLPRRQREVADLLATGETTGKVARIFNLTPGRISQMRQELKKSWSAFQGEPVHIPADKPSTDVPAINRSLSTVDEAV